jgi:hypothetical protein
MTVTEIEPHVCDFALALSLRDGALAWPAETRACAYRVYRRVPGAARWGRAVAVLPGTATGWRDPRLTPGTAWEYRVTRAWEAAPPLPRTVFGYLCAGQAAPLVDARGTVLLVIADDAAAVLPDEIVRLSRDLAGDGWTVRRLVVARDDAPAAVKARIAGVRAVTPDLVALYLLGRVPVPMSGWMRPDGHEKRAFPADAYYGDFTGDWPARDGGFTPNVIPGRVEVAVGRVDFADLPAFAPLTAYDLLRRYLQKTHDFRHGRLTAPARAFIDDNFGVFRGEAFAQNGWRNFAAGGSRWRHGGEVGSRRRRLPVGVWLRPRRAHRVRRGDHHGGAGGGRPSGAVHLRVRQLLLLVGGARRAGPRRAGPARRRPHLRLGRAAQLVCARHGAGGDDRRRRAAGAEQPHGVSARQQQPARRAHRPARRPYAAPAPAAPAGGGGAPRRAAHLAGRRPVPRLPC